MKHNNIFKRITAVISLSVLIIVAAFPVMTTGSYAASSGKWKKTSVTVYTKQVSTQAYKKATRGSKYVKIWYGTKLKQTGTKKTSQGTWFRVKMKGKTYYILAKKSSSVFTKTIKSEDYYLSLCKTDYQKAVLKEAFSFLHKNTAYDFNKKYSDGVKRNGKYTFHCSGFATYIVNKVMTKEVPPYYISSDLTKLQKPGYIVNEKITGQIKSYTVCSGKLDYSKLKPGDILLFKEMESDKRNIDHAGIYIGNKKFIQSTRVIKGRYTSKGYDKDGGVCIAPLTGMYKTGFKKAIRVLPNKVQEANLTKTSKTTCDVFKDSNCKKSTGNKLQKGDQVTILFTYRTSTGKHNAYIKYDGGKKGYLYLYEEKLK